MAEISVKPYSGGTPQGFNPDAGFEIVPPPGSTFDPNAGFDLLPPQEQPKKKGKSADEAGVLDYVAGTAGGFNKGLGLPVDFLNDIPKFWKTVHEATGGLEGAIPGMNIASLARHIPTSEKPFMGSKWLDETAGLVPPAPETPLGHGLARVGEELGASALPSGLILKASHGVKLAANTGIGLIDNMLAQIARTPGKAAAGELAATVGSGTGAAVAQQAFPGNAAAESTGQIVGGMSPAAVALLPKTITGRIVTGAGDMLAKGAAAVATPMAKENPQTFMERLVKKISTYGAEEQAQKGREEVRKLLGQELTPGVRQKISEAAELGQDMPGFKPSIAEASGSPSLVAQQKDLEARSTGADLDRIVNRHRANTAAVNDFAERAAPQAADNPEFVVDAARRRVDTLRDGVQLQSLDVQAQRQANAQRLAPVDRQQAGGTLREQLQLERAERRQTADQLSASLGLDDIDVTADFTRASQRILANHAPTSQFDDVANSPRVLDDIRRAGRRVPVEGQVNPDGTPVMENARVSFRDLKGLRERVSDDLIDAAGRTDPSRKQVRQLVQLRDEVDGLFESMARNSSDPTFPERYAQFRRAYFDDYIVPFEQGAAHKVMARSGRNFFKTTDEQVSGAFFKAGDVTAADQFNSIFANRPEARAALRASAIDSLREFAVRDGVIDQGRLISWLRSHRTVLERFPDIRNAIATPAMADHAYIQRQTQLAARQSRIESSMLTKAVESYGRGATAESVIDAALKEPRKMAQLVGAVRRVDGALPALRRNIWDRAVEGDAGAILNFLDTNKNTLNRLFAPEHLGDIRKIAQARAMLQRVPDPSGAAYVPRPLANVEKALGIGIPTILADVKTLATGRAQKEWIILTATMRMLRGRAATSADDALRAALYDPIIAKELAQTLERGSTDVVKAKRLQARMIALGLPLVHHETPSDE